MYSAGTLYCAHTQSQPRALTSGILTGEEEGEEEICISMLNIRMSRTPIEVSPVSLSKFPVPGPVYYSNPPVCQTFEQPILSPP